MSSALQCPQQSAQVNTPLPLIDPALFAIEAIPAAARPPDPPPPPPPVPAQLGLAATYAWTPWECYWWMTLIRANTVDDDQYVRRTLAARAPFARFTRWSDIAPPDILRGWTASMRDRFYAGIDGTANDTQLVQYVLTHALGRQEIQGTVPWNTTFAQQGYIQAQRISMQLALEPAGRPIALLGHSYGGAVASVVFQIFRQAGTVDFDRLVTAGQPRTYVNPNKLTLDEFQYLRFVNPGDPVPDLPPPRTMAQVLLGPFDPQDYPYGDYSHWGQALSFLGGQALSIHNPSSPSTQDWIRLLWNFLSGGSNLEPHFARDYVRRARSWAAAANLESQDGWADPMALDQVNSDLASIGV
jgi:hypothetical protein